MTRSLALAALALLLVPAASAGHVSGSQQTVSPPGRVEFDVSALGTDGYATGSCGMQVPTGATGAFLCGVDRDDDTFVTNSDPHPHGAADFDDDFTTGVTGASLTIHCFEKDVAVEKDAISLEHTLDAAFNDAGGDWDTVVVALDYSSGSVPIGIVVASLDLTSQSGSCGTPDGH